MSRFVRDWSIHPVYSDILVSDSGIILSYKKGDWFELKQNESNFGYLRVGVGHSNPQFVHRLVAQTFLHNPDPEWLTTVNHIDGDKKNNFVENLEWMTQADNNRHAWALGLKVPKGRKVRIVETGEVYSSQAECARAINGLQGNIALCLLGARKRHRGFTFEHVEED